MVFLDKNNKFKQINWYPGHMFKSFKEIDKNLKIMDLVFVLIDARIPSSSMNPQILKSLKHKPTIIIFNKMDLANQTNLNKWINHYETEGFACLAVDARNGRNINNIKTKVNELLKDKIERTLAKGLKIKNFKAMVLGIPNVGKSTLINTLANRKSAKVGDKPGVTKTAQWIKTEEGFDLLDMPGVLWPKLGDKKTGYNLAITGAIKDDILPLDDVVHHLITFMQNHYLKNLQERYSINIEQNSDFVEVLDIIGKARGALIKGGEIDYDRVYTIILNDLRSNQLGEVSLDII